MMSALDDYLYTGHHFLCDAHRRKGDVDHPCSCGYDKAIVELAQLKEAPDRIIRFLKNEGLLKSDNWVKSDVLDAVINSVDELHAKLDEAIHALQEANKRNWLPTARILTAHNKEKP